MSKKLSKEDRDMIVAERLGGFLNSISAIDQIMSGVIKDKAAKNVLTGSIALNLIDKITGKKGG